MDAPTFYVERAADLRYLSAFPAARIYLSRVDRLSLSKDVALLLKAGVDRHGWVVLNLDQVTDVRDMDYFLCAMEEYLAELAVDEESVGVDEEALQVLLSFSDRFSADRSVGDEEGIRAVVTAVRGVVRAARSPRVEGDDTRVVKGMFGVARAVTTKLFRAVRSPRVAVVARARSGRSPGVQADDTMAGLARAALGEVRAARARPVVLDDSCDRFQVSSVEGLAEVLSDAPPRTHGVWRTVRVLHVRGVARLSDAADMEHQLQRCSKMGWRVPLLKKVGNARRLDSHLVLLNHNLKAAFNRKLVNADGSVDFSGLRCIGEQIKELLRICAEEIGMFQSEVATLPDVLCEIVVVASVHTSPEKANIVREMANKGMMIIRNMRAQEVRF